MKPPKADVKPIAVYYLALLPTIREVARGMGYAVGIHGSMSRDFDLIAAPWAAEVAPPRDLAEALREAVHGHWAEAVAADPYHLDGQPGAKPHGRLVWSIHTGGGAYIDLSVMPKGVEPCMPIYPDDPPPTPSGPG